MFLVPNGVENLTHSCLYTSSPISWRCCRTAVAADPDVIVTRMYLRFVDSCIQDSASCVVPAAVLRSASTSTDVALSALSMSCGYVGSCIPCML